MSEAPPEARLSTPCSRPPCRPAEVLGRDRAHAETQPGEGDGTCGTTQCSAHLLMSPERGPHRGSRPVFGQRLPLASMWVLIESEIPVVLRKTWGPWGARSPGLSSSSWVTVRRQGWPWLAVSTAGSQSGRVQPLMVLPSLQTAQRHPNQRAARSSPQARAGFGRGPSSGCWALRTTWLACSSR